jgi:hypothetical protein
VKLQFIHQIASTSTLICRPIPPIAPPSPLLLPKLSPLIGYCLGWTAQRLHSAVAGYQDCHLVVTVQSPPHNCAPTVVVNTIVAILLLVIAIVSSLSSAPHCAVASCLPSCPSSASSPPAGCSIASPDAAASHLPSTSAFHCALTSCHAPLVPPVQLIFMSPLLTLLPPIISVVVSAIVAAIGGGRESSPSSPLSASSSSSFIVIVQLIVMFTGAVVSRLSSSPSWQLPRAFPSLSPSPVAQRHC